jgi:hypothetical protein
MHCIGPSAAHATPDVGSPVVVSPVVVLAVVSTEVLVVSTEVLVVVELLPVPGSTIVSDSTVVSVVVSVSPVVGPVVVPLVFSPELPVVVPAAVVSSGPVTGTELVDVMVPAPSVEPSVMPVDRLVLSPGVPQADSARSEAVKRDKVKLCIPPTLSSVRCPR